MAPTSPRAGNFAKRRSLTRPTARAGRRTPVDSTVPESPGVFMMHAAMKVLIIDGADNLRKKLSDSHSVPCVSNATRFRFMEHSTPQKIKEDLLEDYKDRHEGKLPLCMQNQ